MSETISVYYGPVQAAPFAFHMSLVHQNSQGEYYMLSLAESNTAFNPQGAASLWAAITAAMQPLTNGNSPYGVLTWTYDPNSGVPIGNGITILGQSYIDKLKGEAEETLLTGDDLSSTWQKMVNTEDYIVDQQYTYSPLSENSNSGAETTIQVDGLPLPT